MSDLKSFLEKAERSFQSAQLLLQTGNTDFAASRAYYGCFYVASALLKSKGLQFARHGQVVGQFGLRFARDDETYRRYHQILARAFDLRMLGDYAAEVLIENEDVEEIIKVGREFLADALRYLEETEGGGADGEA